MDNTSPATVRKCCHLLLMTVSCCPQLDEKKGSLVEEELVGAHWVVVDATEEVDE